MVRLHHLAGEIFPSAFWRVNFVNTECARYLSGRRVGLYLKGLYIGDVDLSIVS